MYAYIRGKLAAKQIDAVIVDVQGVGYRIFTAMSTLTRLPLQNGAEVKLFTHLTVREDAHILFGFLTQEELSMFEILLKVSGVGPKVALSIMSAVEPSGFGLAVLTEDVKMLTRAQGVGAKLAQKIVFELKDKMRKEQIEGFDLSMQAFEREKAADGGKFSEAVSALTILGFSPLEARKAVLAVFSEELEIEEIVKAALKSSGT